MSQKKNLTDMFKGFSKLTLTQRWKSLVDVGLINSTDAEYLQKGGLKDLSLGEKFIENAIGYFQVPLGVAAHFQIDGRDLAIPMAVEETSIIAAASKTAKWIKENGQITTEVVGNEVIGQVQFAKVKDFEKFQAEVLRQSEYFVELANREVAFGLVRRGGGVRRLFVRKLDRPDGFVMAVIHIFMDPCDAMGANIMNQVCEFLKEPLEQLTGEKVTMCILSNLVDSKLTRAKVVLNNIDPEMAEKIVEASLFSQLDPYRAATNNKGVLNGIDPILLATGNDWRAVEAGVHAYAARSGQYSSITRWFINEQKQLEGIFEAPLIVGTVGGVTALHPTAQLCLQMLKVESANELSRICAAVGLVQNLGALKALTTVGIIEGHMKLHTKNLALGAGAKEVEIPFVQKKLEEILTIRKRISLSNAIEVLNDLRKSKTLEVVEVTSTERDQRS